MEKAEYNIEVSKPDRNKSQHEIRVLFKDGYKCKYENCIPKFLSRKFAEIEYMKEDIHNLLERYCTKDGDLGIIFYSKAGYERKTFKAMRGKTVLAKEDLPLEKWKEIEAIFKKNNPPL